MSFRSKKVTKIFTFIGHDTTRKCIFNFKYFETDDKYTWVFLYEPSTLPKCGKLMCIYTVIR